MAIPISVGWTPYEPLPTDIGETVPATGQSVNTLTNKVNQIETAAGNISVINKTNQDEINTNNIKISELKNQLVVLNNNKIQINSQWSTTTDNLIRTQLAKKLMDIDSQISNTNNTINNLLKRNTELSTQITSNTNKLGQSKFNRERYMGALTDSYRKQKVYGQGNDNFLKALEN
jgi:chromosome segregation ATPase